MSTQEKVARELKAYRDHLYKCEDFEPVEILDAALSILIEQQEPVAWIDRSDWDHAQRRKAEGLGADIVVTLDPKYDDDLPVWIGATQQDRDREAIAERINVAIARSLPPEMAYRAQTDEVIQECYNAADAILASQEAES